MPSHNLTNPEADRLRLLLRQTAERLETIRLGCQRQQLNLTAEKIQGVINDLLPHTGKPTVAEPGGEAAGPVNERDEAEHNF